MSVCLIACVAAGSASAASITYLFTNSTNGWTSLFLQSSTLLPNAWRVDPANNAELISPAISWSANAGNYIRLGITNTGADLNGKWYFLHTGETVYTETNSAAFTQTAGGGYHVYTVPMSKYDHAEGFYPWSGNIIKIRLDPVVTSSVTGDFVDLDFVFVRQDDKNPDPPSFVSYPSGWFNGSATVTVTGNDPPPFGFETNPSTYDRYGSGVSDFRWHIDSGPDTQVFPTASNPLNGATDATFVVPASALHPGVNQLAVYAFDKVARAGVASVVNLNYDPSPPGTPTVSASPGGWTNSNSFYFSWNNPGDAQSGVAYYDVLIDGGYIGNTGALNVTLAMPSAGSHTVQVRAVDNVGNAGAYSAPATVYLDVAPPTPSPVSVSGPDTSTTDSFTFNWGTGSDDLSGVGSYAYSIDGAPAIVTVARTVTGAFAQGVEGAHIFYETAIDNAGNWSPNWQAVAYHYFPRYVQPVKNLVPSSGPVALPVTFSWTSSGASFNNYIVDISPDPSFTSGVNEFTTDVAWFMMPAVAAPNTGQPYYWRVATAASVPPNWCPAVMVTPFVPPPPPAAQVLGQDFPAGEAGSGVNTSLGAVSRGFEILTLRGPGGDLPLEASYSSQAQRNSLLGSRWNWTLGQLLTPAPGVGATLTLEDNQDLSFTQSGASFTPGLGIYDSLASTGGGYVVVRPSRERLTFSATGQLQEIADRSGNAITLQYSGGVLVSFTDPGGRTYNVTVTNSRVSQISDVLGRTWHFEYDGAGYLSAFVDARGARTQYEYDGQGQLTRVVDPLLHNALRCTYDTQGRVITQLDALGGVTTFGYDDAHHRTTVTNPLLGTKVHVHDANSRLIADLDERGDSTSYTYDANHNRILVRNARGFTTRYQYDPRGNVARVHNANNDSTMTTFEGTNSPTQRVDVLGHVTTYLNDPLGRPVEIDEPLSRVTHYLYNTPGQVLQETDPNGHVKASSYDPRGNLVTSTNGVGDVLTYGYDAVGRRTSVTDGLLHTRTWTYDANDNPLTETNALAQTTVNTFDLKGRKTVVTDPRLQETHYVYDDKDRQIQVTDPLGNLTEYVYDALDRRIRVVDPRGGETIFGYDPAGNLTSEHNAAGNIVAHAYDANHNRVSTTDGRGKTTTQTFDLLDRLLVATDPLGHTTSSSYDALGRVVAVTDARGSATTYNYDALGRLVAVHAPGGAQLSYTYDAVGNLTAATNAVGHTTLRTYDFADRLLTKRDPLSNVEAYIYDIAGRRIRRTDARGRVTNYIYEAADRLVQTVYSDSTKVLRSYDSAGNLSTMTDTWGSSTFNYDGNNRLTTAIDHFGKVLTFAYDSTGNLGELGYPSGEAVTYAYDPVNRLAGVTDWKDASIGYTYDANSNPQAITHPNGVTTAMAYDDASRLTTILVRTPANDTLVSLAYVLDENGNRTRTTRVDRRTDLVRGGGADVYATSALLSSTTFPAGADSVVLASGDEWSEAAAAPSMARRLGMPALVVPGDNLWASGAAKTELARLKTLHPSLGAIVLGDIGSISDIVEAQLQQQGISVRRIRGADRSGTAALTASVSPLAVVVAANDDTRGPAAALLAGRLKAPLVFTGRDSLPPSSQAALATTGAARTILVGDESAIGTAVADWLNTHGHPVWRRYASADPVSVTAQALEDSVQGQDRYAKLQVASRDAYPDALSAGAGPSPWSTATLLAGPDSVRTNADVVRWVGRHKGWLQKTTLLGPVTGLSAIAEAELRNLLQTTVTEYVYSALDELTSEITPGVDTTLYVYDAMGNRASVTHNGVQTPYTYDGADRLVSAGATTFTYDGNGNRLTRTQGAVTSTYTFDCENRLTQIVGPEGTSKYRYDGNGQRIRSEEPGRIVRYVVDPTSKPYQTLREMSDANVTVRSFVFGQGLASDLTKGGSVRYYHFDGLGSTAALTDSSGNDVGHLAYTAFGDTAMDLGATSTRLGFVGKFGVEGTISGLTFMRDRFYDEQTGLFLGVDPEPAGEREFLDWASYLYAAGNPVLEIDPNGHAWWNPASWRQDTRNTVMYKSASVGMSAASGIPFIGIPFSVAGTLANAKPGGDPWQAAANAILWGAAKGVISGGVGLLGTAVGGPVVGIAAGVATGMLLDRMKPPSVQAARVAAPRPAPTLNVNRPVHALVKNPAPTRTPSKPAKKR